MRYFRCRGGNSIDDANGRGINWAWDEATQQGYWVDAETGVHNITLVGTGLSNITLQEFEGWMYHYNDYEEYWIDDDLLMDGGL